MDEEGIGGGVDFMNAIGEAIKSSRGLVAVIDEKFCGSTYCNNELAMAQGNGLQLFPILFRDIRFDALPAGLQYMLASINVIPFPHATSDESSMLKMHEHMLEIFAKTEVTGSIRHGGAVVTADDATDASSGAPKDEGVATGAPGAVPEATDSTSSQLSMVPLTVPELPDVVSARLDVVAEMRVHLLGFMASGTVSLSSVKGKSKVAAHGQGGVGKTTMAAMLVNDPLVRQAFDRIGWVSVGQTPNIMEVQRSLFAQLTGAPMPSKDSASVETQLEDLQTACKGKRLLVVLDDVWDRIHERQLNCVDSYTASKQLVTTRIRGLMQGCDEVSLNLMAPDEATDLLLRAGHVTDADEASTAAARQIAELCGFLPLYLMICGGVILSYDGEQQWQEELIEMLQSDRVGLIDDASSNGTVACLVDSSVKMLKDDVTAAVFAAFAVCPEDVLITLPVAQIICSSDEDVLTSGKLTAWRALALADPNDRVGGGAGALQLPDSQSCAHLEQAIAQALNTIKGNGRLEIALLTNRIALVLADNAIKAGGAGAVARPCDLCIAQEHREMCVMP